MWKFEGICMCNFCKNQVPSFRYFITCKQAFNVWKISKTLKLLFSKTTQGNYLKFFIMVLTNQDLLVLISKLMLYLWPNSLALLLSHINYWNRPLIFYFMPWFRLADCTWRSYFWTVWERLVFDIIVYDITKM